MINYFLNYLRVSMHSMSYQEKHHVGFSICHHVPMYVHRLGV